MSLFSVNPTPDDILVNITEGKIVEFAQQMAQQSAKETGKSFLPVDVDLSKSLRCQHFSLLEQILQNPLQEFVSTRRPQVVVTSNDQQSYFHLFDGRCANYNQDGVQWRSNNKMSVKLIIFNQSTGTYKLKNNKNDEGEAVMRRQTWQGLQVVIGNSTYEWRKHEYKLISTEQYLKPEQDGSLHVNQIQNLQSFPVLVHYFKIKTETQGNSNTKKRKLAFALSDINALDCGNDLGASNALDMPGKPMNLLATDLSLSTEFSGLENLCNSSPNSNETNFLFDTITPFNFQLASSVSSSMPIHFPDASNTNITGTIKTYAPDSAPCQEYTKVLLQTTGFQLLPDTRYTYACQFSNKEVPAVEIAPGVLEFHAPPQPSAGVVYFWVICKASNSLAQFSTSAAFYYLPVDETALVALQLSQHLTDSKRSQIVQKFRYTVRDLDLSDSNLKSLEFLNGLHNLSGLILDNNSLTSSSGYPFLPKLRSLSVNNNAIDNLEEFLDKVTTCFPSLRCLSMVNNLACPYFNQMTHRYYNYKIYVISRIPLLSHLDGSLLGEEDKVHAQSIKI